LRSCLKKAKVKKRKKKFTTNGARARPGLPCQVTDSPTRAGNAVGGSAWKYREKKGSKVTRPGANMAREAAGHTSV